MKYSYIGHVHWEDRRKLGRLAQAGRRRDKSCIPTFRRILQQPPNPAFAVVALHGLTLLGDIRALSLFDEYSPPSQTENSNDYIANFAFVCKRRLQAEHDAAGIRNPGQRIQAIVESFRAQMNWTTAEWNTQPLHVPLPSAFRPVIPGHFVASSKPPAPSIAAYGLQALADMAYRDRSADRAAQPLLAGIDFARDYASALKMRFVPLSRQQRIATLIDELSRRNVLRFEDDYDIQLAINAGLAASRVAVAALHRMDNDRDAYNPNGNHIGFAALFDVISGVGDPAQMPLLEHFTHDHDPAVRHYATIAYDSMKAGIPREKTLAY